MSPETFLAFREMKQDFEKRRKLRKELSHDEFAALFVRHRTKVLDVLIDAELALSIAGENAPEVPA